MYPLVMEWAGFHTHRFVFVITDMQAPFDTGRPIIINDFDSNGKQKGVEDTKKLLRNYLRNLELESWGLNTDITPIQIELPTYIFMDDLSNEESV